VEKYYLMNIYDMAMIGAGPADAWWPSRGHSRVKRWYYWRKNNRIGRI
jgi:hypothetical protein